MKKTNIAATFLSVSLAFSCTIGHAAPGGKSLADMLSSALPAKAPKEENERPEDENQP